MHLLHRLLVTISLLAAATQAAELSDSATPPSYPLSKQPVAPTIDARAHERLTAFRSDYLRSFREKNPALLAGYFAATIRLMAEHQGTVLGRANAGSYFAAFLARFDVHEFERKQLEALDLGSRVIEVGEFTMKLSLKTGGPPREVTGNYLDIWEKTENGALSLNTLAWNESRHVAAPEEFRFADVPSVIMALQGRVPVRDSMSFQLAALNQLLETAISQHDGKVWSQFFADDAVLLTNYNPACHGKKAVDAYIEKHVRQLSVFEKLDIRNDRIDVSGNHVVEYATHVANWRNGDSSGVNTGKNIRIWRRERDGSLKIFRQIGMYD